MLFRSLAVDAVVPAGSHGLGQSRRRAHGDNVLLIGSQGADDPDIHSEEEPEVSSDIREFYQNVMAVLEGREESRIKLDEVARVMRLMEAVFRSAEEKRVVRFEE